MGWCWLEKLQQNIEQRRNQKKKKKTGTDRLVEWYQKSGLLQNSIKKNRQIRCVLCVGGLPSSVSISFTQLSILLLLYNCCCCRYWWWRWWWWWCCRYCNYYCCRRQRHSHRWFSFSHRNTQCLLSVFQIWTLNSKTYHNISSIKKVTISAQFVLMSVCVCVS